MENTTSDTSQKKGNTNKILIILLAVSILGNIAQTVLGVQKGNEHVEEVVNLNVQKDAISALLEDSKTTVNKLSGENEELNAIKLEQQAKIAEAEAEVKRLIATVKDEKVLAKKLKYQLSLIRKLNKELEDKVDQLLVENKKLSDSNTELQDSVSMLSHDKDSLSRKVTTASILKSEYLSPVAYKRKKSGKFRETRLAKRTNKIEVNLSVMDNAVAEKGEKTVYLRIVNPEGNLMGNPGMGSGNFVNAMNGDTLKYSSKKEFTYSGEKQDLKLSYEEEQRIFIKGEYQIDIFIDGHESSNANYTLK